MEASDQPIQTRRLGSLVAHLIVGDGALDVALDVRIETNEGETYYLTFMTAEMITRQMKGYESTGECSGGLYFWCSSLVVLRELDEDSVLQAIQSLFDAGELRSVAERIFP